MNPVLPFDSIRISLILVRRRSLFVFEGVGVGEIGALRRPRSRYRVSGRLWRRIGVRQAEQPSRFIALRHTLPVPTGTSAFIDVDGETL